MSLWIIFIWIPIVCGIVGTNVIQRINRAEKEILSHLDFMERNLTEKLDAIERGVDAL